MRSDPYNVDCVPRSNFDTFPWAFTTIFQIMSGENWNTVTGWATAAQKLKGMHQDWAGVGSNLPLPPHVALSLGKLWWTPFWFRRLDARNRNCLCHAVLCAMQSKRSPWEGLFRVVCDTPHQRTWTADIARVYSRRADEDVF